MDKLLQENWSNLLLCLNWGRKKEQLNAVEPGVDVKQKVWSSMPGLATY